MQRTIYTVCSSETSQVSYYYYFYYHYSTYSPSIISCIFVSCDNFFYLIYFFSGGYITMSARLFAVRATNHTFPLPVLEHIGRRHPALRQRKKKRLPPSGQSCSSSSQIHSSRSLNWNRWRKMRRMRRRRSMGNILTTIMLPPGINPTTGALSWTSTPVRGVGGSVVNLRMGELV